MYAVYQKNILIRIVIFFIDYTKIFNFIRNVILNSKMIVVRNCKMRLLFLYCVTNICFNIKFIDSIQNGFSQEYENGRLI